MKNVMVDLETLGTVASSVIMSIGAVRFDPENDAIDDDGFYASISIDSNLLVGRQISEDTLLWWLGQSAEAQKVFHEPKQPLEAALESFSEWFGSGRGSDKIEIWSNGADFDLPMLRHAYHLFGWDAPWGPFMGRCVRTFKNLPGARNVPKPAAGVKHNALSDAIAQARLVQAIHRELFGKKVAV
jgi:DNA polymerase III epsilon subunit-like protein